MKVDHPQRFINSVVKNFKIGKECGDESLIIPPSLFEITNTFISVENEIKSKRFLKKFHKFTNNIQNGNNVEHQKYTILVSFKR